MPIGLEFPSVLDAARAGAEWAWRSLYQDLAPSVLGYVRARGAVSPEDVCGDVFCQVVRDIHSFEGDEAGFRSWVFVLAHHRLIDEARRRKRRPEISVADEELRGVGGHSDTETEAIGRVEASRVTKLIGELTEAQRDVILLRLVGGLSIQEVAEVMGKGERAVKSLQHRGLETLRSKLEAEDPNESNPHGALRR
jgi:RNA polymerase sigma-70 factor (ECF subfamily)